MITELSTRVPAPALTTSKDHQSYALVTAHMMDSTQSSHPGHRCSLSVEQTQDSTTPILQNGRTRINRDLPQRIRLATWNAMTLSGTKYQVALAHELAHLHLTITGITEARPPGSGCHRVEDSILLYSGGAQHTEYLYV